MARILLVEDNEMNRDMLGRRLLRRGHELDYAGNGIEAVDKALETLPDIIVMDMNMPEMDGWEATRRIKANSDTRGIPVLALTAYALSGDREECEAAGCDDYATKPVDFKALCEKIDRLLSESKVA